MKKVHLALYIAITILFLIVVQILFSIPAPCKWLDAVWEAGDFISFAGTIVLGLVSVYQTKKANDISIKLLEIEEERSRPQIDIRVISKDKLRHYNIDQLISASIEGVYVYVDKKWNEEKNSGDNFWFEIKNVKGMDVINIVPITAIAEIIGPNGECVSQNKYFVSTSCRPNLIQGNDAVPFLLGLDNIWTKVAQHPNQSLLLSLEFKLMNSDGKEYLQIVSLKMNNAYCSDILSPVIIDKEVGESKLL